MACGHSDYFSSLSWVIKWSIWQLKSQNFSVESTRVKRRVSIGLRHIWKLKSHRVECMRNVWQANLYGVYRDLFSTTMPLITQLRPVFYLACHFSKPNHNPNHSILFSLPDTNNMSASLTAASSLPQADRWWKEKLHHSSANANTV